MTSYDDAAPVMESAPPRVSFGPKEWQSMQLEVASMLCTLWREEHPEQFGAYLARVLTGTAPSGRKVR